MSPVERVDVLAPVRDVAHVGVVLGPVVIVIHPCGVTLGVVADHLSHQTDSSEKSA